VARRVRRGVGGCADRLWSVRSVPSLVIVAGYPTLVVAGVLVGVGMRYSAGCTSGHGVCGMSRLSPRSVVATLTFMAVGFVTVFVTHHLLAI
jgi:uncharacterized membrane protein YedE/YeeE